MWNNQSRRYFFDAGLDNEESDRLFLERYCSQRTARNMEKHQINPMHLRRVLNRLSEVVPNLEQSTPGWSCSNANMLLVVFGNAHLQWRQQRPVPVIRKPRFGLCGLEGAIYLWTERSFIFDNDGNPRFGWVNQDEWNVWPSNVDGRVFFATPLDNTFAQLIAEDQPLWNLIQDIDAQAGDHAFILDEVFAQQRNELGVPEEFCVIYPKLTENRENFDAILQEAALCCTEVFYGERSQSYSDVSAPNKESDVSNQPVQPEEALVTPGVYLTDLPGVTGRYHVYALIDPDTNIPFYIGKGFHDRALAHFRAVKLIDDPIFYCDSSDQEEAHFKMGEKSENILAAEEASDEEPDKHQKIRELIQAGVHRNDVVRIVGRGLSQAGAFAIESLLIKGVYGLDNLTNAVHGKHAERFRLFNDWEYRPGYDLNSDINGELLPDNGKHAMGEFYVYILRDPSTGEIFYVGKGKKNRLCQHFANARQENAADLSIDRLAKLKGLLRDYTPKEIGRIVARVDQEPLAFIVESFYIKFVVGFNKLTNIQPGHLSGMFRSKDDWKARYGFDLPTEVGGNRRELQDTFLAEGLDTLLMEAISSIPVGALSNVSIPRIEGAGELVVRATIVDVNENINFRIQVRCARRIQLYLYAAGIRGTQWIQENFGRVGLYPLYRRNDDMFSPQCWRGALRVTTDPEEAGRRAVRLISFARALENAQSRADLVGFNDLLEGLPAN